MSAASNYTEQNVLSAILRGVTFPIPGTVYIALHTADPTDAGGGEVSTGEWPAYVRQDAAGGGTIDSGWTAPVDGVSTSAKQVIYPGMDGGAAVTVTHWSLYDAATGGNLLVHAPLDTPRQLQPDDVFVFNNSALTVSIE